MLSKKMGYLLIIVMILTLALSACQEKPEVVGGFEIPVAEKDKFNVGMVLIGPHDDGGWSQAHYEGLEYIQENVDDVHTVYRLVLVEVLGLSYSVRRPAGYPLSKIEMLA